MMLRKVGQRLSSWNRLERMPRTAALALSVLTAVTLAAAAPAPEKPSPQQLSDGQRIFRFETFGDEAFWSDQLRLHEVVQQSVSPSVALKVGLKVDAGAI